jgi:nicotinamidase-related amidase
MSLPKELMGVFQMRMAMAWQRVETAEEVKPWFIRDTPGFQLIPELSPRPTEVIFDKITMSAFDGTKLNIVLRDCRVNAFTIVAVAMEVGIEPTARHAADLGYISRDRSRCVWRVPRKRRSVRWPASNILVTLCSQTSKQSAVYSPDGGNAKKHRGTG